jgi:Matrixin
VTPTWPPSRPDDPSVRIGTPPRRDVASHRVPPRVDTVHRRRRPDATLLAVLAIFLAGAIGAVAVGVAPTAPGQVAAPGPSSAGRPGFSDDVPTGPDGPFSFLAVTYVDGQREPVRWNPCQPIEYELDVVHGPPETASAISGALDLASGASGISFRFDGTVDRGFAAMRHGRYLLDPIRSVYRPVLIEVVPHATFRTYHVPKRVLACTHPEKGVQVHDDQWVSGYVVVDGGVRYARTGRWSMELVIAHELGHLLGLGHVQAPDELMFSSQVAKGVIPAPIDGWGPGDLQGLERLGADQGCLPHVRAGG